jgi:hypothetical protein
MQLIYAAQLSRTVKVALVVVVATFALYVGGVVPTYIPLERLPDYWGLPARTYLQTAGLRSGWSWIYLLRYGEFLSCIGIAGLATVTIVCYLRILPCTIRNRDRLYAGIAGIEILVLAMGALGVLAIAP